MSHQTDLLSRVVAALDGRAVSLKTIAKESGVSYDTVIRTKNRACDTGYSKVLALAVYLGVQDDSTPPDLSAAPPKTEAEAA
jgi:hypothetical protein